MAAADCLEADSRVDAQGYPLFLSGNAVFQSPPLAAGWGNLQIQAPAVKELLRLLLSRRLTRVVLIPRNGEGALTSFLQKLSALCEVFEERLWRGNAGCVCLESLRRAKA